MSRQPAFEHLVNHLRDAHAIEVDSCRQLARVIVLADDDDVSLGYAEHLEQSKHHEQTVRELIEANHQEPSPVQDKTICGGVVGLRQLADIAPATPVRLAMRMFALEQLEVATYELLAAIATRAENDDAAAVADRLLEDERVAAERVAGTFDHSARAFINGHRCDSDRDGALRPLLDHLRDVHALEQQSLKLLDLAANELCRDEKLQRMYAKHLEQTQKHERLINDRLEAHAQKPSAIKDLQMTAPGTAFKELGKDPPDIAVKLAMNFFCFEHLEIAAYEQLRRIARRADDDDTVRVAGEILDQERAAAQEVGQSFERAVELMFDRDASYEVSRLFDGAR